MSFGIAKLVLDLGKKALPHLLSRIDGAPEAVEAVKSLGTLIGSVKGFATGPTAAELDALESEAMAGLDQTINNLGDDPA